jgi:hypothetical protein
VFISLPVTGNDIMTFTFQAFGEMTANKVNKPRKVTPEPRLTGQVCDRNPQNFEATHCTFKVTYLAMNPPAPVTQIFNFFSVQ